ncbi:MAG: hypothetical protein WB711_14710 [Terriglobales bacterium]
MSLLRLFLTVWLFLGIATLSVLFWLCKHTPAKEPGKVNSFSPQGSEFRTDPDSAGVRAA